MSAPSYLDAYVYTATPSVADATNLPPRLLSSTTLAVLELLLSIPSPSGKAVLAVHVVDCDGKSVSGATITTSPSGLVRYIVGTAPSGTATTTDTSGQAFIFNVPTGSVVVSASLGSSVFRSHTINARADLVTETEVSP